MDRRLRYGLIATGTLAALVLALPLVVPAGAFKGPVERGVTRATGRAFTIGGPIRFTLLPVLGIRADKVALANVPGGRTPALATAGDVRVGVLLWPLLGGRVEISQIVLERPELDLEVDAQGRGNWTLERTRRMAGDGARLSFDAHFSGVKIIQGHVTYFNARSGSAYALDDLNATVAITALDRPAAVAGSVAYSGRRVVFDAKIATPRSILRDRITALDLSLAGDLVQADFKGMVAPGGDVLGSMKIATQSVRRAGAWLGLRLPSGGGLSALSLQAQVRVRGDNRLAALSDLKLTLDGMTLGGALALDRRSGTSAVSGTLAIDRLDLNPYIETPPKRGDQHPHHGENWSGDPIALDILKKFDADLTLSVGSLALKKLKLGRTRIKVSLNGGRLNAALGPMTLYGGTGEARLDIDMQGSAPAFRNALEFDNVALQPFLSDTIGVHQIEGTGTIRLSAASRGDSANAIMRGLSGSGSIDFHNGHLRGVDLGAVARTIQIVLGGAVAKGAFTDYSGMTGKFTLANGVLANQDFRLTGPLLSMTGTGTVDIGNRAIDFKIVPKAETSIGNRKIDIGIPFRIRGPWTHVHYSADLSGIVKGVIQNLETGKAPFKGIFGNSPDVDPNAPKKKHKSAGDALKNMLGIH